MPLITMKQLYDVAERRGFAVPGYDTAGGQLGHLDAILRTAEEMNAPAIVSEGYKAMRFYFDPECYAEAAKAAIRKTKVPVVLHLDHSFEFDHVARAIQYGFTSVMFDGSRLPYEENVRATREVVQMAHAVDVTVEAELGKVGGLEGDTNSQADESFYTDPELARDFVEKTGIDALAPAVGTAHGFYKEEPRLDFERLRKIKEATRVPLVLHGATGVPLADVKKGIELGIRKVNIATQIRSTFVKAVHAYMDAHPEDYSERVIKSGRAALREFMVEQIQTFGCAGMAAEF
ncbi:MAG: class II fructose-bisphosphate aldolase [Planctomycetes bacterium]|nr:class II fructose-bisphosphate aldolase [Planctomycetota bacterium]